MTTVNGQRAFVEESFLNLSADNQYAFVVLLLERLTTICREVFPKGLPTKGIPYKKVSAATDILWQRVETRSKDPQLKRRSDGWQPVDKDGHFAPGAGADLGFQVANLISELAVVDLDGSMTRVLEVARSAHYTTLHCQADRFAPHPTLDSELDPTVNAALLLEYDTERAILDALAGQDQTSITELQQRGERAARAIAELRDYPTP